MCLQAGTAGSNNSWSTLRRNSHILCAPDSPNVWASNMHRSGSSRRMWVGALATRVFFSLRRSASAGRPNSWDTRSNGWKTGERILRHQQIAVSTTTRSQSTVTHKVVSSPSMPRQRSTPVPILLILSLHVWRRRRWSAFCLACMTLKGIDAGPMPSPPTSPLSSPIGASPARGSAPHWS